MQKKQSLKLMKRFRYILTLGGYLSIPLFFYFLPDNIDFTLVLVIWLPALFVVIFGIAIIESSLEKKYL